MNTYCIIEEEQGYGIVDMSSGEIVNMFYSQKGALAYMEALNTLTYGDTPTKMSWLDSLIH